MSDSSPTPDVPPAVTEHVRSQVSALRDGVERGIPRPVEARLEQLGALRRGLVQDDAELRRALAADLGKSAMESTVTEIGVLLAEIDTVRRNLRRWLRPERFSLGMMLAPGRGETWREPYGLALVISPWNYPLQLAISPLIGAIAGGNAAIIKPSEVAPATSAAISRLVAEHLDPNWVRVVEGGVAETTALLAERFNTIFYTGNAMVGRIVARAAAENLTPVTLELGGKSPAFVDDGVDLSTTARRLVWGKFTNAGQTCVAPDYVMASRKTLDALVPYLRSAIEEMYGPVPQRSKDYGRIINTRHFDRVLALIQDDKAVIGGTTAADRENRYIPPTVLDRIAADDPAMGEEIFGPVLPLVEVADAQDAVHRIAAGDKPLTAYVFTDDEQVVRLFTTQTSSGSLAIGVALAHLGAVAMPFGGVGESGHGAYHGRHSLEAFTHAKPVVRKPLAPDTLRLVYPPFSARRSRLVRRLFDR